MAKSHKRLLKIPITGQVSRAPQKNECVSIFIKQRSESYSSEDNSALKEDYIYIFKLFSKGTVIFQARGKLH